jgi:hypothetical protein
MDICCIVDIRNGVTDCVECFVADNESGIMMRGPYVGQKVGDAAEKYFASLLRKNNLTEDAIENAIIDGYHEYDSEYAVCLVWPIKVYGA